MTIRQVGLDELKGRPVEDVLTEVVGREEILTVRLPGGREVIIRPVPNLKPLPVFDSSIPDGWKDAIYE